MLYSAFLQTREKGVIYCISPVPYNNSVQIIKGTYVQWFSTKIGISWKPFSACTLQYGTVGYGHSRFTTVGYRAAVNSRVRQWTVWYKLFLRYPYFLYLSVDTGCNGTSQKEIFISNYQDGFVAMTPELNIVILILTLVLVKRKYAKY